MKKNDFEFQEMADVWTKMKLNKSYRLAKFYIHKGDKFKKKLVSHNWKKEIKNIGNIYYANKALYFNADRNLPFTTLSLIGEGLSDRTIQRKIKNIINQNALSYNSKIYKLDDLDEQSTIRKAFRTKELEEVTNFAA